MKQEKRQRHIGPSYELFIQPTPQSSSSCHAAVNYFDWQAVSKGNLAGFSKSMLILPVIRSLGHCMPKKRFGRQRNSSMLNIKWHSSHLAWYSYVIREAFEMAVFCGDCRRSSCLYHFCVGVIHHRLTPFICGWMRRKFDMPKLDMSRWLSTNKTSFKQSTFRMRKGIPAEHTSFESVFHSLMFKCLITVIQN